jgi:hypothetical protein
MKYSSDMYKTINFDEIKSIIGIKVGEIKRAKDLSILLCVRACVCV